MIEERGRKCQICGEHQGKMNLHEKWHYDDEKHVQQLEGFILLCEKCHLIKHIGFAKVLAGKGKLDYNQLKEHFCNVNKCSEMKFTEHVKEAFRIWEARSSHEWKQDFGEFENLAGKERRY